MFKDKCQELHAFKKALTTATMFRGKLYLHLKELMNECPVTGTGVRWCIEWEQVSQCNRFGIENMIDKLFPIAEAKKLSEESVKKMKAACVPTKLPRLVVQAAVVADVGREFCIATYFTEGDDPLSLGQHKILERLDAFVLRGPQFPAGSKTRRKCAEAAGLVAGLRRDLLGSIRTKQEKESDMAAQVQDMHARIEAAEEEFNNANLQTEARRESRSGRRNHMTNHCAFAGVSDRASDRQNELRESINTLRQKLVAKEAEFSKATDERKKIQFDLVQMDADLGGIISEFDFVMHCKEMTEAVFHKCKTMMENEHVRKAIRAFMACKVFDILYLRDGPDAAVLERMIDELSNFGFAEFNDPTFVNGMKSEVKEVVLLATAMPFNFEKEPDPSEQLHTNRRLVRRRRAEKRHALEMINELHKENEQEGMDHNVPGLREQIRQTEQDSVEMTEDSFADISWKSDAGERSRRIYEWWRVVMTEKRKNVPCFQKAVRLVVLTQPSSAASERVFSQLTFMRRMVGDQICGEMLELRALLRCNNGLRDDFTPQSTHI